MCGGGGGDHDDSVSSIYEFWTHVFLKNGIYLHGFFVILYHPEHFFDQKIRFRFLLE